eukprot:TRINITY_DN6153_c0_g1_i1.p1 TRINITY_DN6153_c0_g1~~TRINITY_DN6153_c0_g1_i1.p1  ORF type:complete len:377 (+),score=102.71 TRINITY_DN6153_c0_g1_i1:58-1131(+)
MEDGSELMSPVSTALCDESVSSFHSGCEWAAVKPLASDDGTSERMSPVSTALWEGSVSSYLSLSARPAAPPPAPAADTLTVEALAAAVGALGGGLGGELGGELGGGLTDACGDAFRSCAATDSCSASPAASHSASPAASSHLSPPAQTGRRGSNDSQSSWGTLPVAAVPAITPADLTTLVRPAARKVPPLPLTRVVAAPPRRASARFLSPRTESARTESAGTESARTDSRGSEAGDFRSPRSDPQTPAKVGGLSPRLQTLWQADSVAHSCHECASGFTFVRRRHHCRSCGRVFCGSCTKRRYSVPGEGDAAVRVCTNCFIFLSSTALSLLPGSAPHSSRSATPRARTPTSSRGSFKR